MIFLDNSHLKLIAITIQQNDFIRKLTLNKGYLRDILINSRINFFLSKWFLKINGSRLQSLRNLCYINHQISFFRHENSLSIIEDEEII